MLKFTLNLVLAIAIISPAAFAEDENQQANQSVLQKQQVPTPIQEEPNPAQQTPTPIQQSPVQQAVVAEGFVVANDSSREIYVPQNAGVQMSTSFSTAINPNLLRANLKQCADNPCARRGISCNKPAIACTAVCCEKCVTGPFGRVGFKTCRVQYNCSASVTTPACATESGCAGITVRGPLGRKIHAKSWRINSGN